MIAVINTNDSTQYAALKALVDAQKLNVIWYDNIEEMEDTALYHAMLEEPKEYVDLEMVKNLLKQKVNAS